MFYGLATGQIDVGELQFETVAAPLPSLNDLASRGELEVTMISAAAYPYLRRRYVLARCGLCFAGRGGAVLASAEPMAESDLSGATVAVGDATGSATLALQLSYPGARTRLLPADKLAQAAKMGLADCALLSGGDGTALEHSGLCAVADLAAGWARKTDEMPLPLTCVAIRKDLDEALSHRIEQVLRASIGFGLARRAEAVRFAAGLAHSTAGLDTEGRDEQPGADLGQTTLDAAPPARQALEEFLRRGHDADILPNALPLEFVNPCP